MSQTWLSDLSEIINYCHAKADDKEGDQFLHNLADVLEGADIGPQTENTLLLIFNQAANV
jgi:hypothetical protein